MLELKMAAIDEGIYLNPNAVTQESLSRMILQGYNIHIKFNGGRMKLDNRSILLLDTVTNNQLTNINGRWQVLDFNFIYRDITKIFYRRREFDMDFD